MNFEKLISYLPAGVLRILGQTFAKTLPLKPYPGWHFGIAEEDSNTFPHFRLAVWKYYQRNQIQRPLIIPWYHGIRVHAFLGNDTSRLLYVGGCFEPNEFYFLNSILQPGMVFMDVGANEGLYSLFASNRVGPTGNVLAIEPSEREYQRLQSNITLNRMSNVRTFQCALSSEPGWVELAVADYEHAGQNTIGPKIPNPIVRREAIEQVELNTLDRIFEREGLNRLDFVKIDAEGAEMRILLGGQKTIQNHFPVLQLEINEPALAVQGSSPQRILELLHSWGYVFYMFDANGNLNQTNSLDIVDLNVVAAPAGRILN